MKRRYLRDLIDLNETRECSREERIKPVLVSTIENQQPLNVLANLLKQWPLHDLRYNGPDCISTDSKFMVDLIRGMEMDVTQKIFDEGILEVVVKFQDNLAQYERYNLAVQDHNRAWMRQGSPKNIFDPVHGDETPVLDQYVDEAKISSSFYPVPSSAYSRPKGPLAKARPIMGHSAFIKIIYQVKVIGNQVRLGYAAYDYRDRVIYYNQQTHHDLAYLVRRSVQELWGNPQETGRSGCYLEGIPMLIQGKKLKICERDNQRPDFITGKVDLKTENLELAGATALQGVLRLVEVLCRTLFPLSLIVYTLYHCGHCLVLWNGGDGAPANLKMHFLGGMLIIAILFFVMRWVSQYADRKVSQIDAAKRFI